MEKNFVILTKEELKKIKGKDIKNINIGIMGHIDSGKTSITKLLTTIASTASLDKNPQSQEKGITIDIGFSSFTIKNPKIEEEQNSEEEKINEEEKNNLKENLEEKKISEETLKKYLQFTLVDCPGHASFMKSVIAGASIIDLMILVIDINKGIQVQTAECIALGEIMQLDLIVILNKCDMVDKKKIKKVLEKKKKSIYNLIQKTKYPNKSSVKIIPFSCKDENFITKGKTELISTIFNSMKKIKRKEKKENSVMIVDHCFNIKGKGTILTGTVIQGGFSLNEKIELPEFSIERKIKGIHSFKKEIKKCGQGDRVAFLVTNLKSDNIERCFLTTPGYLRKIKGVVATVNFCDYFKSSVNSKSKFHISISHLNLMADIYFFVAKKKDIGYFEEKMENMNFKENLEKDFFFDVKKEYTFVKSIEKNKIFFNKGETNYENLKKNKEILIGYFKFSKSVFLKKKNFYLASRFDFQTDKKVCRIAFSGTTIFNNQEDDFEKKLKLVTYKKKYGEVDKIFNEYILIVKNIFKKETNISVFVGNIVKFDDEENLEGEIIGTFGASGKIKVRFNESIKEKTHLKGKKVYFEIKKIHKL